MGPEPATQAEPFQPEIMNGVDGDGAAQLKQKICSDIHNMISKKLGPYVEDLAESMRSAVLLCNRLVNDVEAMQETATTTIKSIKETRDKIPGQVCDEY